MADGKVAVEYSPVTCSSRFFPTFIHFVWVVAGWKGTEDAIRSGFVKRFISVQMAIWLR